MLCLTDVQTSNIALHLLLLNVPLLRRGGISGDLKSISITVRYSTPQVFYSSPLPIFNSLQVPWIDFLVLVKNGIDIYSSCNCMYKLLNFHWLLVSPLYLTGAGLPSYNLVRQFGCKKSITSRGMRCFRYSKCGISLVY